MVFAWSMQFIVIEWQVYSITKDPLGIIGLMEVIPAVSMALFAGHIVDQKEKKSLLVKCILAFSVISFGLFLYGRRSCRITLRTILYSIYFLVFLGSSGFLRTNYLSLLSLLVPKKYILMRQLGVVPFGKLLMLWDLPLLVSRLL
jgi:hypothetical protein